MMKQKLYAPIRATAVFLLAAVMLLLFASCGIKRLAPKDFHASGMTVTLTNRFEQADELEGYTFGMASLNIAVFGLKEPFSLLTGLEDIALEDYAAMVQRSNQMTDVELQRDGERIWFEYEYENPDTQDTYHYWTHVYKSDDAFWMIQFACLVEDTEKLEDTIQGYANTVRFE